MIWDSQPLLAKAQTYFARAFSEERESSLFGIWIGLGVEHLARAAVAATHPVLLADPRDGKNLLFAFGVETKSPRSVQIHTVLNRCAELVPDFSREHETGLMAIMDLRNSELHSASAAFEDVGTSVWLVPTLRAIQILARHLEHDLADMIGADEAAVAEQMFAESSAELRAQVLQLIAQHKELAEAWGPDERERRQASARRAFRLIDGFARTLQPCPACGANAEVIGDLARQIPPQLLDDEVIERSLFLPSSARCPLCELELRGHERLMIAGLGDAFTDTRSADAAEYFGERYAEQVAHEEEYGND